MSKIASKALTTSAIAQTRRLEFVTNNIANVMTPGYKVSRPVFQNILSQQMKESEGSKLSEEMDGKTSFIDFSEAPLLETGARLDLAIEGPGFFTIATKNGYMYTRNGQFMLDKQKRLVTQNGYPVMGQGGEIVIDGKNITIERNGSIFSDGSIVGNIKVVDFKDKAILRNFGMSLFAKGEEGSEEIPSGKFSIKQGFIEASNVNLMEEMVNLINCIRAYEACDKAKSFLTDANSKMMDMTRLK